MLSHREQPDLQTVVALSQGPYLCYVPNELRLWSMAETHQTSDTRRDAYHSQEHY